MGGVLPGHDAAAPKTIVTNADKVNLDPANSVIGLGAGAEGRLGSSIPAATTPPPPVPDQSGVSVGDGRREETWSACRVGVLAPKGLVRPSQVARGDGGAEELGGVSPTSEGSTDPANRASLSNARTATPQQQRYSMSGAATAPWERHTRGFGSKRMRVCDGMDRRDTWYVIPWINVADSLWAALVTGYFGRISELRKFRNDTKT